jgi:regulator of protease activity HflC (stomatin/prohibitin superfamily)
MDIVINALALFLLFGAILLLLIISSSVYVIRQAETMIIERFGRYDRILYPGIHIIIPFIERPRQVMWSHIMHDAEGKKYQRFIQVVDRIDMRESVYDFPKQNVITKDNVTMQINALLYYQITDTKAAVYEVLNLPEAIEKLTQTTLRNVIGSMDLDESLVSRDQINERLQIILDEATDKWGVKVNRVELQEVIPPADIRVAMEKQMRAERDRRAVILEAEGTKRAAVLQAEGERESTILRAQGDAESRIVAAEAEANARLKVIEAESLALSRLQAAMEGKDPVPYLIAMNYIKALPEITKGKNDKLIILPYEAASFQGALATMKQVFQKIE